MAPSVPNQWRCAINDKRPSPYVLLLLKLEDNHVKRGWWTGQAWDGLRVMEEDVVIQWKINYQAEEGMS